MQDNSQKQLKTLTVEQLKARWNGMAPVYSTFDVTMQTFYYTLVNMLKLSEAKHILEIACGIGKLIPYSMTLKQITCSYLATDFSEKMIEMAKIHVDDYIHKLGVTNSLQSWMAAQNLEFRLHNGEEVIDVPYKFDRIICNLVLMMTQNPGKMLKSLHSVAEEGCLLGVTIWGDKKLSNFLTLPDQAKQHLGRPLPASRQNFHLYNKLQQIGGENGWEVIVQWQQIAPFNVIEPTSNLTQLISRFADFDPQIIQLVKNQVNETFQSKKTLNFPVQMAILRRK